VFGPVLFLLLFFCLFLFLFLYLFLCLYRCLFLYLCLFLFLYLFLCLFLFLFLCLFLFLFLFLVLFLFLYLFLFLFLFLFSNYSSTAVFFEQLRVVLVTTLYRTTKVSHTKVFLEAGLHFLPPALCLFFFLFVCLYLSSSLLLRLHLPRRLP
jgi:hypothetical protein